MSYENLISVEFPQNDIVEIKDFIQKIKAKMPAGLVSLTPEERQTYPKMGNKTIAFVQKALDFATIYPDLVPVYVNVAELKKDMEAVEVMLNILHQMEELTAKLDDSILLAGSEAYTASLSIYNAAKDAARRNVAGAAQAMDELKLRFPGRKSKFNASTI
jgi:hypothetical protein